MRRGTRAFLPTLVGLLVVAGGLPLGGPSIVAAQSEELFFSEYIEGSSNNKALEIFNGTGAAVDLGASGYNVRMYFNGNSSAGLTLALTGTVADDDVFVLAHSSAAAAILAQADLTNGAGWFNGDDAVVLHRGDAVIDSIGQIGVDPGAQWGSGLTSTADNTLRRKSTITQGDTIPDDAFDPALEWDGFATDTFDGLGQHSVDDSEPASPVINEFVANHDGTDTSEYIEIYGDPDTDYSAYTVLHIEGDGAGAGTIDTTHPVGTTDSNGIWMTPFLSNGLENGTITLLLVAGFDGVLPNDVDTDNDGTLDVTPWEAIVDDVAVSDGGTSDRTYASTILDSTFGGGVHPGGASRIPNGVDTDSVSDWTVNDFDGEGLPGFSGTPEPGEALNTPGAPNQLVEGDAAPAVASTTPADGATGVAVDSNVEIAFSEAVDVAGSWFDIDCETTGGHTAVVSGGPTSFVLNPDSDFAELEDCTVTVAASGVTDQDTDDPPDSMAADHVFTFEIEGDACEQSYTPIYDIQGDGNAAAITGDVTTQGIVVGDFEGGASAEGFYLQDLTGDGDPATSDGIFVFTGNADAVDEGDVVRVSGFARERFNQTTINGANNNFAAVTEIVDCDETGSVEPADVEMPFPEAQDGVPYLERFEGMLVRFPQSLVIAEYFNYDRFGEIVLALPLPGEDRHFTPTSVVEPGDPANARLQEYLQRRITLDDGLSIQNPDFTRHPNGDAFTLDNRFRGGDLVANATGVLAFDFSIYRIQPTAPADYTAVNPRPAAPEDVGGRLKAGSLNMLNYFLTLDDGVNDICGPDETQECRGADNAEELARQRIKLLEALAGMDADVVGVNEIENTTGVDPLADIVAGLNDMFGPGTYDSIDTGTIGSDAIKVGLIYRPGAVTPVGDYAILDSSVDPRFNDEKSRPALAQTFEEVGTGARFTVIVNHLKSKGSDCNDLGDPDVGDGQGNCNLTREAAAEALVDWAASDPTGSDDPDFLITGDLNAYAKEDPIDAVKAGPDDVAGTTDDYTDLLQKYVGPFAYTYVFDGQNGYLDHALTNASLTLQVTGATAWHINADEPDILDYDTSFKSDPQDALFEPNAYRSSDHDPVIVGLDLALPGRVTGSGTFSGGSFSLGAQRVPNGTLAGSTSFEIGGLGTFTSTGYEWLVVEAPAATYAGSGTLNGNAGYEFLVAVHDGGTPGTNGDLIRLIVWDSAGTIVYDSQPGDAMLADPTSPLTSGNLQVGAR